MTFFRRVVQGVVFRHVRFEGHFHQHGFKHVWFEEHFHQHASVSLVSMTQRCDFKMEKDLGQHANFGSGPMTVRYSSNVHRQALLVILSRPQMKFSVRVLSQASNLG